MLVPIRTERMIQLSQGQVCREELGFNCWAVTSSATVVNAAGQPQPNVSMRLWPWSDSGYTDAKGHFESLSYATGKTTKQLIGARHEASGQAVIVTLESSEGNQNLTGEIVLKPAYAITGRVVDPNGAPMPGARVELLLGDTGRIPSRYESAVSTCVADANGAYRFTALPANESDREYYAVAAYASGYNGDSVSPIRPDGPVNKPMQLEPIVLKPADRTVSGIVFDSNDNPVPGALVETPRPHTEDAKQPYRRTLTDRSGRFCIEGLCTGPVKLSSVARDAPRTWGQTQTAGDERNVRIVLGQTLEYAKHLVGTPLPDWNRLGLSGVGDRRAGKAVLLCLVDTEQRSSRHFLQQLADHASQRNRRAIETVVVPLSDNQADTGVSDDRLHTARCDGDPVKLRRLLGVQSLPWLILTDSKGVIVSEGFDVGRLDSLDTAAPEGTR